MPNEIARVRIAHKMQFEPVASGRARAQIITRAHRETINYHINTSAFAAVRFVCVRARVCVCVRNEHLRVTHIRDAIPPTIYANE